MLAEISSTGAEPVLADPDRVATLASALAGVGVLCILLGSARGTPDELAALHGPRLQMLLTRVLDSAVRGVVYEASGSVDRALLDSGASLVSAFCSRSRIPFALLPAVDSPASAADQIEGVLGPRA
jgi:hypothetical protein